MGMDDEPVLTEDGKLIMSKIYSKSKTYRIFWNCRKNFCILKGGKGSGKSVQISIRWIYLLMQFQESNLLVVRKVFGTHRDSTFAQLKWAIHRMGLDDIWESSVSPLRMTHKQTGQQILFRGVDDAQKVASITVPRGYLNFVWFEELYEISSEEEFDRIVFSIRGRLPEGMFMQIVCSFNPWSESWIKKRFFTNPLPPNVWSATTTYRDNEFMSEDDYKRYEQYYITNPRMAKIVCDGEFGIAHGLIYTNWVEETFDIKEIIKNNPNIKISFGLDFGYSISYNAFVAVAFDVAARELWVFDELYCRGIPNLELAKRITQMGYSRERIFADSAEPKSIHDLRVGIIEKTVNKETGDEEYVTWKLPRITEALKGNDSVMNGIQRLQGYKWHVHRNCVGTITELKNYCFETDNSTGEYKPQPIKDYDHCMDSIRYSTTAIFTRGKGFVAEAKGIDAPEYRPKEIDVSTSPVTYKDGKEVVSEYSAVLEGKNGEIQSVLPKVKVRRVYST